MTALTVTCSCWCDSTEVVIPVEWVSEGRTAPCDLPSCEPGCPTRGADSFDEPWEEPTGIVTELNRKRIMLHDYDARADSSSGLPETVYQSYPGLLLSFGPTTCECGCMGIRGRKAKFLPGHDARLKGKLQRALAAEAVVHWVGPDGSISSSPALDVARYYGWAEIVQKGADRITARSATPIAAEKRLYKVASEGREGYTLVGEPSRWEQTGRLITFWRNNETGHQQAMYVTPDGQIETFEETMAS